MVVSGPSGVGKDAALKLMRELERPWHFLVTATTRPKRPGERDGLDYIFLTSQEFQSMVDQGGFLEHAAVYGRHYGVPRSQIKEALAQGQDVILKVDVQGAATIKRLVPQAVYVFLAPPSMKELETRLRERHTEDTDHLKRRLETAQQEMECVSMFDYLIVNESQRLEEAVSCIDAIITVEKCRYPPRRISV